MITKKIFFLFFFLFFSIFIFSQEYKIDKVNYFIQGTTKEKYLDIMLDINKEEIFSKEDFDIYIKTLNNKINNLRMIEKYELEVVLNENNSDLYLVTINIKTIDSKNFIIVPYPKYDTNEGLVCKLKLRNSNIFGTLSELESELIYAYTEKFDHKFAGYINFNVPVYFNYIGLNLFSELDSSYLLNEKKIIFDSDTGLEFFFPHNSPFIKFGFNQIADYNSKKTDYNDWYLSETLFLKFPFYFYDYTLSILLNSEWQIYPNILYSNNVGFNLFKNSVNWIDNFRKGFIFDTTCLLEFYYNKFNLIFHFENSFSFYNNFSFFALNFRLYSFYNPEDECIGSYIRGITDSTLNANRGILLNIDLPIRLININKNKWYDFELQCSPFIDLVYADKFIFSGGLEFIVFPRITRSIQLRASAGLSKNDLEIFIGIGLFY